MKKNKQAKKPQKFREEIEILRDIYQAVFSQGGGKVILEDLKKNLNHARNLYFPGQTKDDLHYNLGRQSVINDIMAMMETKK